MKIPFNRPPIIGSELQYIKEAIDSGKLCGDGDFTRKCNSFLQDKFKAQKVLLTSSCTSALDMSLLMCNLKHGDEVILPSFTFSSTANAAVLAGASLVFVDIRPDTMNIDETKIEQAITKRTKAIIVMHYAGVSCEMDEILDIAKKYGLIVIEDAAQCVMSSYKGNSLGTIGTFGCYSFHETKNLSMGEGGALIINSEEYNEPAEILREKGTNRSKFIRGEVDKYTWVNFGDSYLPSELNAAFLWGQLLSVEKITNARLNLWKNYYKSLLPLAEIFLIELPIVPSYCTHNAHIFFIKLKDEFERNALISFLKGKGIYATFHYVPLHSSPAGKMFGRFSGEDVYTTTESSRLIRLPLFYGLTNEEQLFVIQSVYNFFGKHFDML